MAATPDMRLPPVSAALSRLGQLLCNSPYGQQ
jgi:hypothetical protein